MVRPIVETPYDCCSEIRQLSLFKAKTPIHHYSLAIPCYRRWHHAGGGGGGRAPSTLPGHGSEHVSILPASGVTSSRNKSYKYVSFVVSYSESAAYLVWVADAMRQRVSAADRRAARIYTLPYCTTCSTPLICASLHFALHFEGSFRHRAAVSVFYTLVTYSAVSALVDIYKAAAPAFPAVKWKSAVCC